MILDIYVTRNRRNPQHVGFDDGITEPRRRERCQTLPPVQPSLVVQVQALPRIPFSSQNRSPVFPVSPTSYTNLGSSLALALTRSYTAAAFRCHVKLGLSF